MDGYLGEVDGSFGFDDEEGVGVGAAGGAEFLAGFVEGFGEDREDDFTLGATDEIETALLLDELELGRHFERVAWRVARRWPRKAAATKAAPRNFGIASIHRIGKRINRKAQAGDGNFDLYQFGTDAAEGKAEEFGGKFAAKSVTAEVKCGEERGAAAGEGVEDEVAFVGGGEEDALEEGDGFLRGVLAEFLLPGFGRTDFPDGLHLLAAIDFLHELVIEDVARFGVFGGPDDGFGRVGEITAGKIGRRIGLDPGNVVEELEAELLHGEADGMDDVGGAGDPDGAVGLQDALAGSKPGSVEFVNLVKSGPY